ncbi:MAG: threonine synthase, partial [Phycisphaerae bacterium]
MSLVTKLTCVRCKTSFAAGQCMTCPRCGLNDGILDVQYDLDRAAETLTCRALSDRTRSHWWYRELLPLDDEYCPTEGGVGWTPLTDAPRLAGALGVARLRLKDDGRNPSGSFKDRASSVGVAHARQLGFAQIACASTGNAASSLAHCAAVEGLRANIFVPATIPDGKLAQLLAYGARVFKVRGSYADAFDLCTQACAHFGWYNRNCAINPYLVEGKKTGGLELAEQCADDPPDWVVCSVGDGCSIAGVHKGLVHMKAVGVIAWETRMLGVQAGGVAPIAKAFETGALAEWDRYLAGENRGDTYADSINVPVPRNWRKAVSAVRDSNGTFVTVTDEQIKQAVRDTGRLTGIFAEPAAAAAVTGVAEARRQGLVDRQASVVGLITGNGLKDLRG